MLHPVLKRQLKKLHLKQDATPDAESWALILERVNQSYQESDQNRYILERSLELSSEEMRDLTYQLQFALDRVRNLSLTDELTGLRNRRYLNVTLPESVAQVIRHYRHLAPNREQRSQTNIDIVFLMIDLDLFKAVNDRYGHIAGDRVLIQMREILLECSRLSDFVVRWGGEEFLVVARNSNSLDQKLLAERILTAVEAHPFDIGKEVPIHLTCSIGTAVFPFLSKWPEFFSWDQVVELADLCLYAAKRSGRNSWVGILPTDLATPNDLTLHLDLNLPDLIQEGKLELMSNLPDDRQVQWTASIYRSGPKIA